MTVVKYLLPFSGFKLKSRRLPALIRAPKVSELDRMSRKRRAEMFGLVFLLIPLAALDLGVTSPTVPTELAQSAWHPAADYLCGRRQPRCTRAGGTHPGLLMKQNSSSNLRLYPITRLI